MSLSRVGPACGLLFAPLYAGFTFVPELPEAGYTDAEVLALYEDPLPILVAAALIAAAGVAFLVFLTDLMHRLRESPLSTVVLGAGLLYVAALFLAGTFWSGYANGGAGPLEAEPDLDQNVTLARILTDMGFGVLLFYGLVAGAVLVAAASVAGRRTGALPRWLTVTGLVVAPLLLAGFTWIPQFLVPLWVLAVSVHALRPTTTSGGVAAPAPAGSGR